MIVHLYRLLDFLQSRWNVALKTWIYTRKWGKDWRDKERTGRRFRRTEYVAPVSIDGKGFYNVLPEPGWAWTCQNCKTYSIIRQSDMPAILAKWEKMAQETVARGYQAPAKPTPSTAGCTNCNYRPGAPE